MNAIVRLLSTAEWQHLTLALLHTFWQGVLAAAILWLSLRRISVHRPEARYWVAFGSLFFVLFTGLTTWAIFDIASSQEPGENAWIVSLAPGESPKRHDGSVAHGNGPSSDAPRRSQERPAEPGVSVFKAASNNTSEGIRIGLALAAATWLLGVVVMTVRMGWTVVGLRRIACGPELSDHRIWLCVNEIRELLQIGRSLRIVEVAEAFGPAVLGVWRPVLALPVSMMTGLPPEAVRAIIAHELAHVRRFDYLVNLVQMVVEAVLFFNPAIWWISRQVRIEREACCDAMASRVLGEPLALATALSLWAELARAETPSSPLYSPHPVTPVAVGSGSPAVSFVDRDRQPSRLLLDRVRRMLVPGYQPQMPVSSIGFLGWLLGGALLLTTISCGASAVVDIAAKALTPAERVERVVETQKEFDGAQATGENAKPGKATLSGTIRTSDGKPLPKKCDAYCYSYTRSCTTMATVSLAEHFSEAVVASGKIWLLVEADGYAPAIAGPFVAKAGDAVSNIEIVLEHGFPLSVHVVDENGSPVENANVSAYPVINPDSGGMTTPRSTDAQGVMVLPNAVERLYDFTVRKPGYQPLSIQRRSVKPGHDITLNVEHAKPVSGIVLSSDGKPVADAEIRKWGELRDRGSSIDGSRGEVLVTTDTEGRFTLKELDDNNTYILLVVSKEFGWALVRDVTARQKTDLRVEMGPALVVSGVIHGDLAQLEQQNGKPVVTYSQPVSVSVSGNSRSEYCDSARAPVDVAADGGTFEIRGILPGQVHISAGKQSVWVSVDPATPRRQLSFDLNNPISSPPKREVVFRFNTPDGSKPQGTIQAFLTTSHDHSTQDLTLSLKDGIIKWEAAVPARISYRPKEFPGYWFEQSSAHIEPGDGPLELTVDLIPAGAVAGQVLNADGTPAIDIVFVGIQGALTVGTSTRSGGFVQNVGVDAQGHYFLSPVPLHGTYTVAANRNHTIQSSPFTVDDENPTANIPLRFPNVAVVEGTILDQDGRPIPGLSFDLAYSGPPIGKHSWGHSWNQQTDRDGRFRFDDLSIGAGQYALDIRPRRHYCQMRVPLALDAKPVTVQLRRGQVIEGRLLDSETDLPVPGVELFAVATRQEGKEFSLCEAEGVTDAEGRFRFSNLENQPYGINNRSFGGSKFPPDEMWQPGTKDVVLRANVPAGSAWKPGEKKNAEP